MSSPVPACESVVNSIWRRMQQAWTVTAFRETRGASRRFRSAERGNATSPGLLIERVGSVAPAQLSVKARPVKSTLPAFAQPRRNAGTRHGYVQGCGIARPLRANAWRSLRASRHGSVAAGAVLLRCRERTHRADLCAGMERSGTDTVTLRSPRAALGSSRSQTPTEARPNQEGRPWCETP